MSAFHAILLRDLRVAFRRWSELAHPLIFFVIVVTLFPLALSSTSSQFREVGVGVLWVATLLSSLLALDG
jgi:heme exporter protein B